MTDAPLSDTPDTDKVLALVIEHAGDLDVRKMVPVEHARALEREANRLRAERDAAERDIGVVDLGLRHAPVRITGIDADRAQAAPAAGGDMVTVPREPPLAL